MGQAKVAITMDSLLLAELDSMVNKRLFPNRSRAIQIAVKEKLLRISKTRLAKELENLNPDEERTLAEEGIALERETWPAY